MYFNNIVFDFRLKKNSFLSTTKKFIRFMAQT